MRTIRGLPSSPPDAGSVVALGVFDGVHLAHRAILAAAVGRARAAAVPAVACTFDPHPAQVLQPDRAPRPITTLDERLALLEEAGIDAAVVLEFTPTLAAVEAEAFVKDVLLGRLRARQVVVGFNHRFGRGAAGDARLLQDLGGRLGFEVAVMPPLLVDGVPVSSTEVRQVLGRGDVELARRYLGRPYTLGGRVVEGAGRGRQLGFPTANIEPDRPPLVPPGVYACLARTPGGQFGAVANIGVRPTFGGEGLVIEAHLLDFSGALYGARLALAFARRLREERRFPGPQALREQIGHDAAAARAALADRGFTWEAGGGSMVRN